MKSLIHVLDTQMQTPALYGWFHLLWLALMIGFTVFLCLRCKEDSPERVTKVVFFTALLVLLLEVYKQFNYSFEVEDGKVIFDFEWYAFPWQFCSTPMYAGLLAGIFKKGKVHDALCAYLATYAIFAGLAVMLYPGDVFIGTIGINIQTMICHGSMLPIGAYLLATGHVKLSHKTVLKALPVFAVAVLAALVMNEIAWYSGLLETDTFNMFYISRHCEPSLPVYSLVQNVVPYPWCLILYIAGFTAAAYVMSLMAMGVRRLCRKLTRKTAAAA